jgi:hypothetical protein
MSLLKTVSIAKIKSAIISEATITTMALLCNSFQVGQETFVKSSLVVSSKYILILFISFFSLHGHQDSNLDQRFWRPLFYH